MKLDDMLPSPAVRAYADAAVTTSAAANRVCLNMVPLLVSLVGPPLPTGYIRGHPPITGSGDGGLT